MRDDNTKWRLSFVANLIATSRRLQTGRDIILALTKPPRRFSTQDALGIQWRPENHRAPDDAEFALNEVTVPSA